MVQYIFQNRLKFNLEIAYLNTDSPPNLSIPKLLKTQFGGIVLEGFDVPQYFII